MTCMKTEQRFPELDALRGIAVWMMVTYHLLFDLTYFYDFAIPIYDGGWRIFARSAAALFLLLVGICFVISWERSPIYKKYFRRGLIIFCGGMLISLVTYFIAPHAYVRFGILHLIGVSALLQPFFVRLKQWNLPLGFFIIFLSLSIFLRGSETRATIPAFLGLPLGLTPPASSLDYFPLFPWLGVILIGMSIGKMLYIPSRRLFLRTFDQVPFPRLLLWSGKRSLWIYFLHQPILFALLSLALGIPMR